MIAGGTAIATVASAPARQRGELEAAATACTIVSGVAGVISTLVGLVGLALQIAG
ncbi:MAG TPA: hypothetical protein VK028_14685 [Micromonosporaceae bacterium]|nr:hypothetical protein [Micromonosporaceae bacterium]